MFKKYLIGAIVGLIGIASAYAIVQPDIYRQPNINSIDPSIYKLVVQSGNGLALQSISADNFANSISGSFVTTETDPVFMANSGDYIPFSGSDTEVYGTIKFQEGAGLGSDPGVLDFGIAEMRTQDPGLGSPYFEIKNVAGIGDASSAIRIQDDLFKLSYISGGLGGTIHKLELGEGALEYEGDYSDNFVDGSLVDKRYVDGELGDYYPLAGNSIANPITGDLYMENGSGSYNLEVGTTQLNFGAMIDIESPIVSPIAYVPGMGSFPVMMTKGRQFFVGEPDQDTQMYLSNSTGTFATRFTNSPDQAKFDIDIYSGDLTSTDAGFTFLGDNRIQAGVDISSVISDDKDFITKKYLDDNEVGRLLVYDGTETWNEFYTNKNLETVGAEVILDSTVNIEDDGIVYNLSKIRFKNGNILLQEGSQIEGNIWLDNVTMQAVGVGNKKTDGGTITMYNRSLLSSIDDSMIGLIGKTEISMYLYSESYVDGNIFEITNSLATLNIYLLGQETFVQNTVIGSMTDGIVRGFYDPITLGDNINNKLYDLENSNVVGGTVEGWKNLSTYVKEYSSVLNDTEEIDLAYRQILADTTAGDLTLVLPKSKNWDSDYINIVWETGANSLTISGNVGDTINGLSGFEFTEVGQSVTFLSYEGEVFVTSEYLSSNQNDTTIYNTDGVLTGDRIMDGDGHNLSISGTNVASISADTQIGLLSPVMTFATNDPQTKIVIEEDDGEIELYSNTGVMLYADAYYNPAKFELKGSDDGFGFSEITGTADGIYFDGGVNGLNLKGDYVYLGTSDRDISSIGGHWTIRAPYDINIEGNALDVDTIENKFSTTKTSLSSTYFYNTGYKSSIMSYSNVTGGVSSSYEFGVGQEDSYFELGGISMWNDGYTPVMGDFEMRFGLRDLGTVMKITKENDMILGSGVDQKFTNPTTSGLDFRFAWSGGLMEAQYFTGGTWTTASIFTP